MQVFEQQTVLQSETEFVRYCVNMLHRQKFVHSSVNGALCPRAALISYVLPTQALTEYRANQTSGPPCPKALKNES